MGARVPVLSPIGHPNPYKRVSEKDKFRKFYCLRQSTSKRDNQLLVEGIHRGSEGAAKVRCGPATVLHPHLPSHGLRRHLSSIAVRQSIVGLTSIVPLPVLPEWGKSAGLFGSRHQRQVMEFGGLSLGRGVHVVFHCGSSCNLGGRAFAGDTRPLAVLTLVTKECWLQVSVQV